VQLRELGSQAGDLQLDVRPVGLRPGLVQVVRKQLFAADGERLAQIFACRRRANGAGEPAELIKVHLDVWRKGDIGVLEVNDVSGPAGAANRLP
jgi:hypothetical protein